MYSTRAICPNTILQKIIIFALKFLGKQKCRKKEKLSKSQLKQLKIKDKNPDTKVQLASKPIFKNESETHQSFSKDVYIPNFTSKFINSIICKTYSSAKTLWRKRIAYKYRCPIYMGPKVYIIN